MKRFIRVIAVWAFGALVASCDLQPKIVALPDTVGEFISSRYPTLLADPKTEPEIYNSAVSDYGVYASPDLYGTGAVDEYINYSTVDDYVLPEQIEDAEDAPQEPESIAESETPAPVEEVEVEQEEIASVETESDVLEIPDYEPDEIVVPARAVAGTVVVKRGDTLYAIARANNMTVDEIAKINNIAAPYTIRIGDVLKIEKPIEKPKPVVENKPAIKPKAEPKVEPKAEPVVKEKPKDMPKETPKESPKEKVDVRVPVKTIKVEKGDTLYSLSRRYAVPVNDLAVMNNLSAPFALRVGDSLRVPDLAERVPVKKDVTPKVEPVKVQPKTETKPKEQAKTNVKKETKSQTKTQTKSESKTQTKPAQKTTEKTNQKKVAETKKKLDKKTTEKKVETKKVAPAKTETPKIAARSSSKFSWPVRGKILSNFGAKDGGLYNDGINISAAFDSTVSAAENGVVAYAGNEVRGMGNLIIIQHSDGWMTVYAHLNSMSVRRGARVSVGQKIGTVGQTGKVSVPQLHFEIRNGTKAHNPINYLKK
ncbi:MAG: peptidoglycan DD-metalloendopeptidase family protein [Alphaproteobacteria bacterium]|nr:peptidoglycan DD-metalloendopeptidase family protein [Alphaproteobacteria bacterium]